MNEKLTADRISTIRKQLQRSQEAFARLLGTTQVTVSRWERGESHPQPIFREKLRKLENYITKQLTSDVK